MVMIFLLRTSDNSKKCVFDYNHRQCDVHIAHYLDKIEFIFSKNEKKNTKKVKKKNDWLTYYKFNPPVGRVW